MLPRAFKWYLGYPMIYIAHIYAHVLIIYPLISPRALILEHNNWSVEFYLYIGVIFRFKVILVRVRVILVRVILVRVVKYRKIPVVGVTKSVLNQAIYWEKEENVFFILDSPVKVKAAQPLWPHITPSGRWAC